MASCRLVVICFAAWVFASTAVADPPRYRWRAEQALIYEVNILVDLPDKTESWEGAITYRPQPGEAPQRVSFAGGLSKSVTKKPGAQSSSPRLDPFGPGFGIPRPPSPFARRAPNPFRGLEQTKSQLTIDPRGAVLAMDGSSHLPYLLGNLSLLIFEPLPERQQDEWEFDSGVTITEKKSEPNRDAFDPFGRFGAFGPFRAQRGEKQTEKTRAASQSISFQFLARKGPLATYGKRFKLQTPAGEVRLTVDGEGMWTFNEKLGASETLDFIHRLTLASDNISVVIPISIKYRRLSAGEWKQYQQDRVADADRAAKERLEKLFRDGGYAKSSGLPVTADMRLPSGLVLQWKKDSNNYWPASVIEELDDGTVKAKEIGFRKRTMQFDRGRLQLAPRLIAQPDIPIAKLESLYAAGEQAGQIEAERDAAFKSQLKQIKAAPEKPLQADLRRDIEAALGSKDYRQVERALRLIAARSPRTDEALQRQVEPYLNHPDAFLQPLAKAAHLNCNPDQKRIADLNRAYREFKFTRELKVMGPAPMEDTPLPPGLLVAGRYFRRWMPASIVRVREDGKIDITFGRGRKQTVNREDLRLAPPEVKQTEVDPKLLKAMKLLATQGAGDKSTAGKSPDAAAPENTMRIWTDKTGKYKIEAVFQGIEGDDVILKREDGREVKIPLDSLSPADQKIVAGQKPKKDAGNPFKLR